MADAENYREKAEVKKWQKRDPIRVLDEALVKGGLVARRELHEIQRRVEMQVQDAVVFADTSPFPSLDTLFQNIYAMPLPNRGGAVSGPQVLIPPLLEAKAARLTQKSEQRSREQPALTRFEADAGGPGGRPTQGSERAAPAKPEQEDRRGPASHDGGADGRAPARPRPPSGQAPVRARKLPQPGRPGRTGGSG